jgi:hypothetical protein
MTVAESAGEWLLRYTLHTTTAAVTVQMTIKYVYLWFQLKVCDYFEVSEQVSEEAAAAAVAADVWARTHAPAIEFQRARK